MDILSNGYIVKWFTAFTEIYLRLCVKINVRQLFREYNAKKLSVPYMIFLSNGYWLLLAHQHVI